MAKHLEIRFSSALADAAPAIGLLQTLGCSGDVITGTTVWKGNLEQHVLLRLYGVTRKDVEEMWNGLREVYPVQCAHVQELDGGRAGCIHDYLRPSSCPHVLQFQKDSETDQKT